MPNLMLAREAPADGIDPAGWLVSEKFDGVRAVWDGSALRFRSGGVIAAPGWLTAALPAGQVLDGELWSGRGRFEELSAAVRRGVPRDAEWRTVRYLLFDLPGAPGPFAERAAALVRLAAENDLRAVQAVEQHRLPDRAALHRRLAEVAAAGGEGLMLHRAAAPWSPGRSGDLLKFKPLHDAEAVVVAHQPGQGRHAGRLGALRVRLDPGSVDAAGPAAGRAAVTAVEFDIGTGLSDADRDTPPPPGTRIVFTHRGFTAEGVPRFASYRRRLAP